ncbi:MFS transporter [Kibdelosporangium phytohabitans]|uniref:MFS transporter n=1 Tax=Kibdelosporangium phytohabitans TaxID=860235 RepID=A0A0N9I4K3_9PSEU|nr:MFS transporter [Kibdelosporangium phytohabitans]ALG09478.1 MFS transporter [Kibdelosporangium phytohabitans]MBE1469226.1 MFS family permease [Kibdelosporangium phytohabitans]
MKRGFHGRAAALYAGGFIGPFAGGVTTTMLPELGAQFGVSAQTASVSLTAYLVPFAVLMLFSGTLGARWGPERAVRVAYVVYVAASAVCALSGSFGLFLAARAVQGAANAFTTPLLLAAVAAATPPERLGRALGLFSSLQAVGQTSAPLVGGLAAEVHWTWAFWTVAGVAALLAVAGIPGNAKPREQVRLRAAWQPVTLWTALVALVAWASLGGLSFMVALRAEEVFELGASERGLLLTGFGVMGIISARFLGHAIDRIGARKAAAIGAVSGAVVVAGIGLVPSIVAMAALWAVGGMAAQLLIVSLNALMLSGDGDNRAGAVSVVQAGRFFGGALSPPVFTPVYQVLPAAGFLAPAVLLIVVAPLGLWRAARK